jgi:hypothetical protein
VTEPLQAARGVRDHHALELAAQRCVASRDQLQWTRRSTAPR